MRFFVLLATLPACAAASSCAASDNANDCAALIDFGKSTGYASWENNKHWMIDKKGVYETVCNWAGITCSGGRVTEINLEHNNLAGSIPESISKLDKLQVLNLNGGRPTSYYGCGSSAKHTSGNDLGNTTLPDSFYKMTELTKVNVEYTCLAGTLSSKIGELTKMTDFEVHGNYLSGTIPKEMNLMTELKTFKLGRNPFTGGFPDMRTLTKLVQFNCNFCALTGPVLDIFDNFPNLQFSYWDGNGFTGTLPASVGKLRNLSRISFNINQLSGEMPPSWADVKSLKDCRIGHDSNLTAYLANYPWIPKTTGNTYKCPLPAYASGKGVCNHISDCEDVINPCSPVTCA